MPTTQRLRFNFLILALYISTYLVTRNKEVELMSLYSVPHISSSHWKVQLYSNSFKRECLV